MEPSFLIAINLPIVKQVACQASVIIAYAWSPGFYEEGTSSQISVRVFELTTFRSTEFELSNYPGAGGRRR
jgi:hypothetical protein